MGSVGQLLMHAGRDPPGQPGRGDGVGVGVTGVGGGGGAGVGAGGVYVPLVTHPPHSSSLGAPT